MRFAVDTGGTFTDLVIEDDDGRLSIHKSSTVPSDPVRGILDAFEVAAADRGCTRRELLGQGGMLVHGTTRGLNAVLTRNVAKTAFLTTDGHPDILLLREGGRRDIFNQRQPYPQPYIPRSLTFEVPERIGSQGEVVRELDAAAVIELAARLREAEVEAVAVCLLWSIVNPAHELRVGELLEEFLPGVPVTLSHKVNPCVREYRRASATAMDASLKPLMTRYIDGLQGRLAEAGFSGRLLIVTSSGGALDAEDVAEAPIHSLNSGPSMAPVAGRHYAGIDAASKMAIVADTGGTSYDVSVVRHGLIPWTRESWIGPPFQGHMTGFPSIDVRSVGAGGGSIAWVDAGGLLRVGPDSAGADPGPVCYGRGGTRPTMTDACLVLGYLDPKYFLGGRSELDLDAARAAVQAEVGDPLDLDVMEAAAAIYQLATERMVGAIEEITGQKGIDPAQAVLVGGGGAAGFNTVAIGRRLGCPEVIVPVMGPALSAAGALISELSRGFEITCRTSDESFDFERVNAVLAELAERAQSFIDGPGEGAVESTIEFSVEARYPHQVWELEVQLGTDGALDADRLTRLSADFHEAHRDAFAVADPDSPIEFESWHARARCRITEPRLPEADFGDASRQEREIYLPGVGPVRADVWRLGSMPVDKELRGPAIVETATTTIVVNDGASFSRRSSGTVHIVPGARANQIVPGARANQIVPGARANAAHPPTADSITP
ncbi:hydantoinase/oxoprolinase family protein [Spongiactinospora sp. TRM90649]|uniref:hydantoinase/oxoprolinase family protein n=1 Tax=Spongiactinospora sp. TRM90649 TaxID=3031114 RepID=UPI0023F7715D|nr:hydantoinase/oxoprolinase family protein [Spongiactinospora sp. TRM90649]MDF5758074.1 hydantoinase/oxoprolinase family protein [Spongiactinospora sp. TRM90649]